MTPDTELIVVAGRRSHIYSYAKPEANVIPAPKIAMLVPIALLIALGATTIVAVSRERDSGRRDRQSHR